TCKLVQHEYRFDKWLSADEENKYKYVLDVDANYASGKFKRLMSSRSIVLKSTIFPEWWSKRIMPWYHYIPIQSDYSDLPDVAAFFIGAPDGTGSHDALAKRIAQQGKKWSEEHYREVDLAAYAFRLRASTSPRPRRRPSLTDPLSLGPLSSPVSRSPRIRAPPSSRRRRLAVDGLQSIDEPARWTSSATRTIEEEGSISQHFSVPGPAPASVLSLAHAHSQTTRYSSCYGPARQRETLSFFSLHPCSSTPSRTIFSLPHASHCAKSCARTTMTSSRSLAALTRSSVCSASG
ncbi:glycosyltransferase family 90 protein, partial [Rhodotorula graminis WP1]